MDEGQDFSAFPVTVGELRSDRSGKASDWSPRDALIEVLRQMDSGGMASCDVLLIGWSRSVEPGVRSTGWRIASPDPLLSVGLATRLMTVLVRDSE
jgi:hypothetical protein